MKQMLIRIVQVIVVFLIIIAISGFIYFRSHH